MRSKLILAANRKKENASTMDPDNCSKMRRTDSGSNKNNNATATTKDDGTSSLLGKRARVLCYVETGEECGGFKKMKAESAGVIPMDCVMMRLDAVSKMKQTEVELRNMIDVLQESASYNRDKIKEQKEVISEFQDTVEGLTDDIDEYKENLLEANNVLKKLRRYIGGIVASGQRELGDHYDGFSRVSDFVRDRCRSAD